MTGQIDDPFDLPLDDEWDVEPGDDEDIRDPEAIMARMPGLLLAAVARVDIELANGRAPLGGPGASDTSIEPALEPVQLFQGIGKGGRDVGRRLTVQPLCLD
jgi:hypothetical protein